ncbi:MAG: OB-fold nucleic acid binding domain-containing protein [Candidatus Pacearchaeota archaeon]
MKLLAISLIISLLGILGLLILINIQEPDLMNINQLSLSNLNQNIKIQGKITNIRSYQDSNFQIISINDSTGKIDLTLDKILNLTKESNLIVIGTIQEYNHNLQIQANKVYLK